MFSKKIISQSNYQKVLTKNRLLKFSYSTAQLDISLKRNSYREVDTHWENALSYNKIPGPSKFTLFKSFMPLGDFHNKTFFEIFNINKNYYGNIFKFPGLFGKRDIIITFNPNDFEKVFRTEGQWPIRRGVDSLAYYRKVERADYYKDQAGVAVEQGENWGNFRTIVNPILMQPKTVKLYTSSINSVACEFIDRIKLIRDPKTQQVPQTFNEDIYRFSLESVCLVSLDKRLGLIKNFDKDPHVTEIIKTVRKFLQLMYELDLKPSIWKYIRTPKFNQMIKTHDRLNEICTKYINEAMERIEKGTSKSEYEKGVLEKLVQIDKHVAVIMATDLMIAGIDTTSSAIITILYELAKNQRAQNKLRQELKSILPQKDSPLTKENMNNLPYLRACIKEALRINPVAVGNFRTTGTDVVLSGYQVPKDVDILMPAQNLQRNDAYFPKASKFIPERFLRDFSAHTECPSAKTAPPFIFLPFGFGPRMCIGKRFVELEIETLISRIIRNFQVEYHHPDLVYKTNVVNYPTGNFGFKFIDIEN